MCESARKCNATLSPQLTIQESWQVTQLMFTVQSLCSWNDCQIASLCKTIDNFIFFCCFHYQSLQTTSYTSRLKTSCACGYAHASIYAPKTMQMLGMGGTPMLPLL